jgi:hypothetical protein
MTKERRPSPKRAARNRQLWSLVRKLPGGEPQLRDLVAVLRTEDGSGQELIGTEEYTSTRLLTDAQFSALLQMVRDKTGWRPSRRSDGNVLWLVSAAERKYITFMAVRCLGWTQKALEEFVTRQTKGRGLRTHAQASALIEPLERMVQERGGWVLTEDHGHKWWSRDTGAEEATV